MTATRHAERGVQYNIGLKKTKKLCWHPCFSFKPNDFMAIAESTNLLLSVILSQRFLFSIFPHVFVNTGPQPCEYLTFLDTQVPFLKGDQESKMITRAKIIHSAISLANHP